MDNKKQLLQESWYETLGNWSKTLLKYMYGKDVKQVATVKAKARLDVAIKEFETTTGLKWPFTDEV